MATSKLDSQYVQLPVGTSAERPSAPLKGMTRFNSTLGVMEYYSDTWKSVSVRDGSSSAAAAPSAQFIKDTTGINVDGYYWIDLGNGQGANQVYCIMNSSVDGGGWMALWSTPNGGTVTSSTRFSADTQNLADMSGANGIFNYYSLNYARRSGVRDRCSSNKTLLYAGTSNWMRFTGYVWDSTTLSSGNFRFEFNTDCITSNGTTDTTIEVGFTNYGIDSGGDFGIASAYDGLDHHSTTGYYNLNNSCGTAGYVPMYLYTHGFGYKVNSGLSGWYNTTSGCTQSATNELSFMVLMK